MARVFFSARIKLSQAATSKEPPHLTPMELTVASLDRALSTTASSVTTHRMSISRISVSKWGIWISTIRAHSLKRKTLTKWSRTASSLRNSEWGSLKRRARASQAMCRARATTCRSPCFEIITRWMDTDPIISELTARIILIRKASESSEQGALPMLRIITKRRCIEAQIFHSRIRQQQLAISFYKTIPKAIRFQDITQLVWALVVNPWCRLV